MSPLGKMVHTSVPGFNSRRCGFQRLRDAKSVCGWVQSIDPFSISMLARTDTAMEINDVCAFEVHGDLEKATFTAQLKSVGQCDLIDSLVATISDSAVYEVRETQLDFKIVGPIVFARSDQHGRKLAHNYHAEVRSPVTLDAVVHDVSDGGICLIMPHQFEPKDQIEIAVCHQGREFRLDGVVRHSSPEASGRGMYRSGIQIADLPRIEQAKWRKFVADL